MINKVKINGSDKRPASLITSNDLQRSERLIQFSANDSAHSLHGIISEMKTDLDTLKGQACSELELEVRGSEYLDRVGEFYYKEFLNRCAQYTYHRQYKVLKDEIVQECTEACKELTSGFPEISYTVSSLISCSITFPNSARVLLLSEQSNEFDIDLAHSWLFVCRVLYRSCKLTLTTI